MSAVPRPETDWWWIRHAPVPNAPPFLGWRDPPADLDHPAACAALRRRLPPEATWLASDLRRAVQTAEALADALPLRCDPALREQSFGAWEREEPTQSTLDAFWRAPATSRPPEGESFADLCARVARFIDDRSRPGSIVAVAHAGVIRAAAAHALGLPPERALSLSVDPLSITRLTWFGPPDDRGFGGGWAVRTLNQPFL
ncbi:MAG: histidine phosphatase family protein [Pseudomonadota bacterium]